MSQPLDQKTEAAIRDVRKLIDSLRAINVAYRTGARRTPEAALDFVRDHANAVDLLAGHIRSISLTGEEARAVLKAIDVWRAQFDRNFTTGCAKLRSLSSEVQP